MFPFLLHRRPHDDQAVVLGMDVYLPWQSLILVASGRICYFTDPEYSGGSQAQRSNHRQLTQLGQAICSNRSPSNLLTACVR